MVVPGHPAQHGEAGLCLIALTFFLGFDTIKNINDNMSG